MDQETGCDLPEYSASHKVAVKVPNLRSQMKA